MSAYSLWKYLTAQNLFHSKLSTLSFTLFLEDVQIFLTGFHSMQGWIATMRHEVTRTRRKGYSQAV